MKRLKILDIISATKFYYQLFVYYGNTLKREKKKTVCFVAYQ